MVKISVGKTTGIQTIGLIIDLLAGFFGLLMMVTSFSQGLTLSMLLILDTRARQATFDIGTGQR